jgi:hypothetical protein
MWLNVAIAYKSPFKPADDFMIVCMDNIAHSIGPSKATNWLGRLSLDIISLINRLIIMAGIVLDILSSGIWALTLFVFYSTHWLASLAISNPSSYHKNPPRKM